MAIKLIFSLNREMMRFLIVNKNVFYSDRKWNAWVQCLPKPENFLNTIKMSRNKIPSFLGEMFNLSKEEQEEYNGAKDEDALSEIIIKDCKLRGATLIAKAKEDNKNMEDVKIIN